MRLIGDTSRTVVTMNGLMSVRVEGFQDDRFRLMFIISSAGKDISWTTMKFRKGTKSVNLDTEVWPEFERQMKKAAATF